MFIGLFFNSDERIKWFFVIKHYLASCLMASIVLASRVRVLSRVWIVSSTRFLSYPICTREEMSDWFVGSWLVVLLGFSQETLEKSIDHLRSTMIFWAVFFPIPGTLERSLSSWSSMALRIFPVQSPRIFWAVFPHTPFTLRSFRKIVRSVLFWNQKSVSQTSVMWWWRGRLTSFPIRHSPRAIGER